MKKLNLDWTITETDNNKIKIVINGNETDKAEIQENKRIKITF